ncbi:MAG TPA: hypothetical protein VGF64_17865 [Acidimicrobiales bacterium]
MHPIERLRYVARADGAGPGSLAAEAAHALAGFADDPAALVTACRRLVDRHPTVGPLWWVACRVLAASNPQQEVWKVADELDADPTPLVLADLIPGEATVAVLGWPELVGRTLVRRGDLRVLLVDALGESAGLARRLRSSGGDVAEVAESGLGSAVATSDLVVLEASLLSGGQFISLAGSRAAASVARQALVPVWVVAGAGRVLPNRLGEAVRRRVDVSPDLPWDRDDELVPIDLADLVVGPSGAGPAAEALRRADCPVTPELLRLAG